MQKIGIINCEISNLTSIYNACKFIGYQAFIIDTPDDLSNLSHIILPGVGTFPKGIQNLNSKGFYDAINQYAQKGIPLLGICLGMQLLASSGEEFGNTIGLNLIPGVVKKIPLTQSEFRLPHVGWNSVETDKPSKLYQNIEKHSSFYFIHSYAYTDIDNAFVTGVTDYGLKVIASVEKDNVYGVQFHPEKSQKAGLQLLKNFIELC